MNIADELRMVIDQKKAVREEGSYTSYLFSQGLDKILKKIGEESAETIIAAKGQNREELKNEICDLFYHVMVLMAEKEISNEEIREILSERRNKIGNLKELKNTDRNT